MNLIEILKEETGSLKIQYISMTREWAEKELQRKIQRQKRYSTSLSSNYPSKDSYYKEQRFCHTAPAWFFTPEFIDKMAIEAERHYEDSIIKLAARILKKELVIDNLKIKTAHIGVNIETTLTDGIKTVRAFTIIASGAIQRPHYRYLIK